MSEEIAAWVRKQANGDLAHCRDLIESEAAAPEWSEPSSGVLVTGPPEHDDTWAGTFAIGDSRIVRHVIAHDPRTEIARAESVLAILDEHYILARDDRNGAYEEFSVVPAGLTDHGCGCVTCHYQGFGAVQAYGTCRTVRLLAWGYRHREGWEPEWAPHIAIR